MFNNTNTKTCWNSMNPFLCHQLIVINIRFLPPSHRTGDYEGTTPRSVNAVNPGVYRFWLSPHTRAEESPCRAAVSVNAGIRRRYSAWCVRLEYLYPLKGISVKLSRVGYKPLSKPLCREWLLWWHHLLFTLLSHSSRNFDGLLKPSADITTPSMFGWN